MKFFNLQFWLNSRVGLFVILGIICVPAFFIIIWLEWPLYLSAGILGVSIAAVRVCLSDLVKMKTDNNKQGSSD